MVALYLYLLAPLLLCNVCCLMQAAVEPLMTSFESSIVTLRGQVVTNNAEPLTKRNRKTSQTTPELVKAAVYCRKVKPFPFPLPS